MAGQEFETVSSINKTLDSYRRQDNVLVNIFTFNGEADMLYDRVDISQVKPLTISDVKTGGDSALFDTVASVVKHIRNIHHYIRKEDIRRKQNSSSIPADLKTPVSAMAVTACTK